jgi:hypothetical protein
VVEPTETPSESEPTPVAAAAEAATSEMENSPAPVSEPDASEEPAKPKKRGWWSRALS